ncbi:30S ribosomal protein S5 [Candidatus Persebacteraceae bacterium Df01]|uniref:Small ribosomal subunit protein uS5 n=1 Tax=Candidatus Doriopsillibacter californiensis TaxID=2970740 RepID=A0ABT7QKW8_9GAMM|nr:30S ribosomal protein S5 [Candidatus Persebacteraceae bacterium Df01]
MDKKDNNKPELTEKMVAVNRVTKVVKGGRIMRFSAIMVVGDGDGRVGMGTGKAREVSLAAQKATENARKAMVKIDLVDGTIYHAIQGRHGASRIYMQPASGGTGIIAGGPVRMLFEVVGIRDILAKNIGSANPYNILRAAIRGLTAIRTPVEVAAKRGLPLEEVQKRHRLIG